MKKKPNFSLDDVKQLTDNKYKLVLSHYWHSGSMRETATQLSIPYQTVQFMVKKFSNDRESIGIERRGRPKKLGVREMRRIEKDLKTNPFTTVIELHSRNKTGVHVSTLRRELKKRNYV